MRLDSLSSNLEPRTHVCLHLLPPIPIFHMGPFVFRCTGFLLLSVSWPEPG